MVLTLDRRAFIDILGDGQGEIGGAMMPPPAGSWGMPPEVLQTLPGYGSDVAKNRAEAREIMKKLGYGPGQAARGDRDDAQRRGLSRSVGAADRPAEGDLHRRHPQRDRYDAMVSDRDAQGLCRRRDRQRERARRPRPAVLREFSCGAERNYTGYCSAEVDQLIDRQSSEPDTAKRKQIVWEIERKLAEDAARPAIFYPMSAACWQPYFKGHTMMVNGNYNGWRLEDAWLDK